MQTHAQQIARMLETLSAERLAEVDDFIDFLRARDQDKILLMRLCSSF